MKRIAPPTTAAESVESKRSLWHRTASESVLFCFPCSCVVLCYCTSGMAMYVCADVCKPCIMKRIATPTAAVTNAIRCRQKKGRESSSSSVANVLLLLLHAACYCSVCVCSCLSPCYSPASVLCICEGSSMNEWSVSVAIWRNARPEIHGAHSTAQPAPLSPPAPQAPQQCRRECRTAMLSWARAWAPASTSCSGR